MTVKRDVEVSLADYKNKLTFDWKEDCVIITKTYDQSEKGRETWRKITKIVENELGGKWVPLGKESHWVVPLEVVEKKQPEKPKPEQKGNNGVFFTLHCPYCGKTMEVTVKPQKEASKV